MLEAGDAVERYEVLRVLGEGGHASVYLVRHRTLGSLHALKVLSHTRPDLRERLLQEGRIQARLDHPNIVPVTDVIEVDRVPALVMPYVPGPTLEQWIRERHPIALEEAEGVFRGVVEAVRSAHEAGLVHRDLKPGNVMMAGSEGRWLPRVVDFGIAKMLADEDDAGRTGQGVGLGTPAYMAPEQMSNAAQVDRRADIFALGCIFYELLTGRRLYQGQVVAVIAAISGGAPPDLSALPPGTPDRVRAAILGCLQYRRSRRLPDCDSLLDLLDGRDAISIQRAISLPVAGLEGVEGATGPSPEVRRRALAHTLPESEPDAGLTSNQTLLPADPTVELERLPSLPRKRVAMGGGLAALALASFAGTFFALSEEPEPPSLPAPAPVHVTPQPLELPEPQVEMGEVEMGEVEEKDVEEKVEAIAEVGDPSPARPVWRTAPSPQRGEGLKDATAPTLGRLKVNSQPWSHVSLNGSSLGTTWVDKEIPAGTHELHLRTESGAEHRRTIELRPGSEINLCWDFELEDRCY